MGARALEKGREGGSVKGEAGPSGAGVLFPFLESPELALNGKRSLLSLWCCEINVDLLLLLGLLGVASLPLFLWAGCLVSCWGCFGVKLAHRGGRTGRGVPGDAWTAVESAGSGAGTSAEQWYGVSA